MPKSNQLVAYALAAFMAFMGIQKFIGDVPIFLEIERNLDTMFGLNLPIIDPAMKYFTGIIELFAAALIVFGQRFLGSALSLATIAGAIGAHLTVLGISTPVSSAPDAEKSPVLFIMAVIGALVAAAATYLNKPGMSSRS